MILEPFYIFINMAEDKMINLLSKKYTFKMLKSLKEGPKRFKDFSEICENEKMRTQRLGEFEELGIVKATPKRIGRRSVSFYELSEKGKEVLKITEKIKKLEYG
jgi:DNA-binding HxlR family transcriptional regulator